MTSATTKLQVGTAAFAVVAAASLTPVIAQADSLAQAPSLTSISQALGSSAGGQGWFKNRKTRGARAGIQTKWLWLGAPNPSPPAPQIPVWTFKPLNAVAWIPFLGPGSAIWNYWNQQYSQTCIFGISTFVGPYGTTPGGTTPTEGSITRQWSPNGCA